MDPNWRWVHHLLVPLWVPRLVRLLLLPQVLRRFTVHLPSVPGCVVMTAELATLAAYDLTSAKERQVRINARK